MKFAVAYINFFDNELRQEVVTATDWKTALEAAFPGHAEHLPDDIEEALCAAFAQEFSFCVTLIN